MSTTKAEVKHHGLTTELRNQIRATLAEISPLWQAEPPADLRRVLRPTGSSGYSINVERYRGAHSWISFRKRIEPNESLKKLAEVLYIDKPELLGYLTSPVSVQLTQDVFSLVGYWCQYAMELSGQGVPAEAALDQVIEHLDQLLVTKQVKHEVLSPLAGLKLPDNVKEITLGENTTLRQLTVDEISEIASSDVVFGKTFDLGSHRTSSAIVITQTCGISFNAQPVKTHWDPSYQQHIRDQIDAITHSLHILKAGKVSVIASINKFHPNILPNLSGQISMPLVYNPFSNMELVEDEIETFITLNQKYSSNQRDELRIAAARLCDAENRLSPVDALLDAVIGLEVLLNPNDYAELSFRVALNYAFLCEANERRHRYEEVREIQKTRNRVVHGGLNLQSKDAHVIHEHAELAKRCLRDAITRFLFDETLAHTRSLDAEFWLDRIIPATTGPGSS